VIARGINRRITVQIGLGKKKDLNSKIIRPKRSRGMAQMVKASAPSSNPSTTKKKKKRCHTLRI
jgi:hypothetical protein